MTAGAGDIDLAASQSGPAWRWEWIALLPPCVINPARQLTTNNHRSAWVRALAGEVGSSDRWGSSGALAALHANDSTDPGKRCGPGSREPAERVRRWRKPPVREIS